MSYRDDLDAANQRAQAAERELQQARHAHTTDQNRLGLLEQRLAAALNELAALRQRYPTPRAAPVPAPQPHTGYPYTPKKDNTTKIILLVVGIKLGLVFLGIMISFVLPLLLR